MRCGWFQQRRCADCWHSFLEHLRPRDGYGHWEYGAYDGHRESRGPRCQDSDSECIIRRRNTLRQYHQRWFRFSSNGRDFLFSRGGDTSKFYTLLLRKPISFPWRNRDGQRISIWNAYASLCRFTWSRFWSSHSVR